ncbi:unnamed protein product [Caenorhabditis auriculariae]|uniref:Homeobox domain-containing protein n=1 Tax=Caenorhabditis auriculariae TaxID=2777116 RepID=A0A8S1GMF0_9PELO|nr:unnamed protein product [Caenorhabditis auriculariae]
MAWFNPWIKRSTEKENHPDASLAFEALNFDYVKEDARSTEESENAILVEKILKMFRDDNLEQLEAVLQQEKKTSNPNVRRGATHDLERETEDDYFEYSFKVCSQGFDVQRSFRRPLAAKKTLRVDFKIDGLESFRSFNPTYTSTPHAQRPSMSLRTANFPEAFPEMIEETRESIDERIDASADEKSHQHFLVSMCTCTNPPARMSPKKTSALPISDSNDSLVTYYDLENSSSIPFESSSSEALLASRVIEDNQRLCEMSSPQNTEQATGMSLFTVEQLELIRRLRTTGISSDQVLKAFVELDQVDCVLDKNQNTSHTPNNNNATKLSPSPPLPQPPAVYAPLLLQHLSAKPPSPDATPSAERLSVLTVPRASTVSESSPPPALTPTPLLPGTSSFQSAPIFGSFDSSEAARPIRSQRTPMKEITTLEDPNELEQFMQQGEEACISEMKTFITQYSLRQTTVAMMTGVSQPYISKLLNGNHRELSLRCRKNIYCWYLNCRQHPEKLAAFLQDPSTRLETNGDGELVPQRRERYVFRPVLIRMLEICYNQTPFPDAARRAEIAKLCNQLLQYDKKGASLMPKEVVSAQVVSNWFANKRKEMRRRTAEAGDSKPILTPIKSSLSSPQSPAELSRTPSSVDECSRTATPNLQDENCELKTTSSQLPTSSQLTSSGLQFSPVFETFAPLDLLAVAQRMGFQLPLTSSAPTTPAVSESVGISHLFPSINSEFLAAQQQFAAFRQQHTETSKPDLCLFNPNIYETLQVTK